MQRGSEIEQKEERKQRSREKEGDRQEWRDGKKERGDVEATRQ